MGLVILGTNGSGKATLYYKLYTGDLPLWGQQLVKNNVKGDIFRIPILNKGGYMAVVRGDLKAVEASSEIAQATTVLVLFDAMAQHNLENELRPLLTAIRDNASNANVIFVRTKSDNFLNNASDLVTQIERIAAAQGISSSNMKIVVRYNNEKGEDQEELNKAIAQCEGPVFLKKEREEIYRHCLTKLRGYIVGIYAQALTARVSRLVADLGGDPTVILDEIKAALGNEFESFKQSARRISNSSDSILCDVIQQLENFCALEARVLDLLGNKPQSASGQSRVLQEVAVLSTASRQDEQQVFVPMVSTQMPIHQSSIETTTQKLNEILAALRAYIKPSVTNFWLINRHWTTEVRGILNQFDHSSDKSIEMLGDLMATQVNASSKALNSRGALQKIINLFPEGACRISQQQRRVSTAQPSS